MLRREPAENAEHQKPRQSDCELQGRGHGKRRNRRGQSQRNGSEHGEPGGRRRGAAQAGPGACRAQRAAVALHPPGEEDQGSCGQWGPAPPGAGTGPGVGQRRGARAGEPGKARTHVSAPQAETAAQGPRRVSGRVGTRPTLHAARGATWGEQGRPVFGARGEVVPKCSVTKICKQTAKCAKVNTTLKACRRPYVNILKKVGE